MLLYEPSGALQHPHLLAQLQQQLHRQQLTGAVRLQRGWQGSKAAAEHPADAAADGGGGLTAVLLAGGDGQWPLLAAAAAGPAAADASLLIGEPAGQPEEGRTECTESERSAAIDEAILSSGRLRRRLQAAAGPLAGSEPDYVLVRRAAALCRAVLQGCGFSGEKGLHLVPCRSCPGATRVRCLCAKWRR